MSAGKTELTCGCGQTRLALTGKPILVSECLCDSCRTAAGRLATLPGAKTILTACGGTPAAEYRKDRVRIAAGAQHLKEFRLSDDAASRRVVATCCNTPVFLELKGAHWLSIFLHLWPAETRPLVEMRTMTGDLPDASGLSTDVPNLKSHSVAFFARLLAAWAGMGFRNPKTEVAGKISV